MKYNPDVDTGDLCTPQKEFKKWQEVECDLEAILLDRKTINLSHMGIDYQYVIELSDEIIQKMYIGIQKK